MVVLKRPFKGGSNNVSLLQAAFFMIAGASLGLLLFGPDGEANHSSTSILDAGYNSGSHVRSSKLSTAATTLNVPAPADDAACMSLPKINPSGVFFLNDKIFKAPSPEGADPSFFVGSKIKHVTGHMKGDVPMFKLIAKHFKNKRRGIAFDVGANQGFFTYYLATMGFTTHSFEINDDNFPSLEHGQHYNPKEVADRVNLYPMGLSSKTGRFSMNGGDYRGFLKQSSEGAILSASMDCFLYHSQTNLKEVDFVKIDVEGFEMQVMEGGVNTLFHPSVRIGALLMEVGPSRWKRAGTKFEDGLEMMKNRMADQLFEESFIILRSQGSFAKECPTSLAEKLTQKTPVEKLNDAESLYKISIKDWEPLLNEMNTINADCNFWFSNS